MAATHYEFRVDGRLSARAQDALAELTAVEVRTETVMFGAVADDSQLHGILARFQDLGLRVLSMHQIAGPVDAADAADRTDPDERAENEPPPAGC